MDYYKRYMGDYQRDTGDLSLAQHGAYTVLLDHYYSVRKPLPAAMEKLHRLCRATTKAEQEAVETVADEFFPVAEDGQRHNLRADQELEKWEEVAEASRENGKKGGNPHKKQLYNERGFLYAASLPDGRIKVGITADVAKRRYGLSRTHGRGVEMLCAVVVDDMGRSEAVVLKQFAAHADGEILTLDAAGIDRLIAAMGEAESQAIRQPDRLDSRQPDGVTSGVDNRLKKTGIRQPSASLIQTPTPIPDSRSLNLSHTQSARTDGQDDEITGGEGRTVDDPVQVFQLIQATYPKFTGRQDWLTAQHHFQLLTGRDQIPWTELSAAVERYAAFVSAGGVSGPQYVMTPAKFFSAADKPWQQSWDPPPSKGQIKQDANLDAARTWLAQSEGQ